MTKPNMATHDGSNAVDANQPLFSHLRDFQEALKNLNLELNALQEFLFASTMYEWNVEIEEDCDGHIEATISLTLQYDMMMSL